MTQPRTPEELVRRIYEDGFNGGDETAFDECYSPAFVHHSKVIHDVAPGGEGEKQSMLRFRAAIPDVRFEVLEVVEAASIVAVRLRVHGHAATAYGTVAAGDYDTHAVAWFRIEDGSTGLQVVEEWFFTDAAA